MMSADRDDSVAVAELRIMVDEKGFGDSELQLCSTILPALGLFNPDRQIRFLEAAKSHFADHADEYIAFLRGTRPRPKFRVIG